jgi:serine/threonine protein phosphatase PrpC/CRP-like cAMP-binding protein
MRGSEVQFSALTDVGRKRDHNEDNFLVDKSLSLFIVCDGMGGHAAGEVASALAVHVVHEQVKRESELLADYLAGKSGAEKVSKRDILNMLEFAVNRASARVHAEAMNDPAKRGMGTTLVAALVLGNQTFIVYVGDSRIYLLRDGVLEQLTEDHTVYNELVKRKKLPRERIEELAPKNAITRAVGVYDHAEADTLVVDVLAGDRFLLCTDGLSGYFEDDLEGLGRTLMDPDAEAAIRELIDTANRRGGKDNITAIIFTVGDVAARDEARAKMLQLKRETLARMPLFRPLTDRELLRVLQVTDVLPYRDGEVVIREGDRGEELYIVLSGQAQVLRGEAKVATLSPGEHFGEMALIRNQPRSATVKAEGKIELIVLRRTDFFEILRKEHQLAVKLLWQFTGVLAERLAHTTQQLGDARDQLAAEDITAEVFEEDEEDENRVTLVLPPKPHAVRDK